MQEQLPGLYGTHLAGIASCEMGPVQDDSGVK